MGEALEHLRFAQASDAVQLEELKRIIRASPVLMETLETAKTMGLPDWWVVSGAIYNQVWNDLTGRPEMYGVKDIDLFYFDPDTSWEAEDAVIQRGASLFRDTPPVEIRNQARVHIWYKDHFGEDYPALGSSAQGIDHFACKTHCIGVRLTDDLDIYAPFGLLGRAEGFLQTHLGFQTIEHACSVKAEQNDKNQDGDHDDSFGIHSIAPSYTMSTARQFY